MSGREWKPGDVALVRNEWNVWNVAICTLRADHLGWWWRYGVADDWSPIANPDVRPLVVIDPEDREQVERLTIALYREVGDADWNDSQGPPDGYSANGVQAALREFANPTPPKPDEPQGLGAVVEDARGHLHTRARNHSQPWVGGDGIWRPWVDIDAVTSLSEGVKEGDR